MSNGTTFRRFKEKYEDMKKIAIDKDVMKSNLFSILKFKKLLNGYMKKAKTDQALRDEFNNSTMELMGKFAEFITVSDEIIENLSKYFKGEHKSISPSAWDK